MSRKLFAAALLALSCTLLAYSEADAADEVPAPRPAQEDKKAAEKPGFGGGKFGKGQIDPEKLKMLKEKFGDKIDPEKLKELKEKFGDKFGKGGFDKSKIDPEKLKALKEKLGKGGFDKSKIDPEKLKELKEKFKKGGGE